MNNNITTIDIAALGSVTGGGAGYCDFAPPQYSGAKEGAGALLGAVYGDTGKVVPQAQIDHAQGDLAKGKDWNDLCSGLRRSVAPNYRP
jgi:hypothetical protein